MEAMFEMKSHMESVHGQMQAWELFHNTRVLTLVPHQCEYSLVARDDHGKLVPAQRPTRWATTPKQTANKLCTRCSTTPTHQPLRCRRATDAAAYALPRTTELLCDVCDTAGLEHPGADRPDNDLREAMTKSAMIHDQPPSISVAPTGTHTSTHQLQNSPERLVWPMGKPSKSYVCRFHVTMQMRMHFGNPLTRLVCRRTKRNGRPRHQPCLGRRSY